MLKVLAGEWQAAKLLLKEGGLATPEWLSYNPSLLPEAMRQALIIEDYLSGAKPSPDWKPILLQGGSQRG